MKQLLKMKFLMLYAGLFISQPVFAVVSCSATAALPNSTYVATAQTYTTGSVTVTCTRNAADLSDPSKEYVRSANGSGTVTYNIAADGLNPGTTILRLGANALNYSLRRPPSFTSQWSIANTTQGQVFFGPGVTSASNTTNFGMRINADLWNAPEGIYTEVISISLTYGTATSTANVTNQATVSSTCIFLTSPIADLDFGIYSSLTTGLPITATSAFQIRCTRNVVYAFSYDAASSTIPGVNLAYSLATPAGGTAANAVVNRNIVGTMNRGQPGTCNTASCTGSQPRTLMLSY